MRNSSASPSINKGSSKHRYLTFFCKIKKKEYESLTLKKVEVDERKCSKERKVLNEKESKSEREGERERW
jgi:hypothetical protein